MLRLAEEGGDGRNDAVDEDAPRDGRPEDAGLFSDNGPPQSAGASAADCAVTVSSRHIESREPVLNPAMAPPRAAKVLRGPCSAPGRQNADTRTLEPGQSAPKSECIEEWFALPWQPHLALEPQGPQHRIPLKAATPPQCSQRGNTHKLPRLARTISQQGPLEMAGRACIAETFGAEARHECSPKREANTTRTRLRKCFKLRNAQNEIQERTWAHITKQTRREGGVLKAIPRGGTGAHMRTCAARAPRLANGRSDARCTAAPCYKIAC